MDNDGLVFINSVSTWNSGGGIVLDVIELRDGRGLAVSEESVILYSDMDDLTQGEAGKRETIFL